MSFTFQCELKDGKKFRLEPLSKEVTIEALKMSIALQSDIPAEYQQS